MLLAERYRPKDWREVIGQDAIRAKVDALRPRGLGGRAYFLSGPSGCGKTTIARLIAEELADDMAIEQYKARLLNARQIDTIARGMRTRWIGARTGRVAIINEIHGISRETLEALLDETEPGNVPAHAAWIFTTTNDGLFRFDEQDDSAPLLSRCIKLPLAQRDLTKPFAAHLVRIGREAGILNGMGDEYYTKRAERLLKDCRNNLRMALNEVETGYLTASDAHE